MGTFTRLDGAAIQELATAFGLGQVGAWAPIALGTVNSNFELECDGKRYFLRVNEGKTAPDIEWEARVIDMVLDAGVATPRPLRTIGNRVYASTAGKLCTMFPWTLGDHLKANQVTAEHAASIGSALARMHRASTAIAPAERQPSRYSHAALAERLANIRAAARPELVDSLAVLEHEYAWASQHKEPRGRAEAGVIHGDLFRDNVLWWEEAPILLDFEQASAGSFVYDLAVAIHDWCWDAQAKPLLMRSLLAGYDGVRALTAADRAALPIELRAAAMRFAITRITDVYLPGIANSDKDYREFMSRLLHWQRLAPEGIGVE